MALDLKFGTQGSGYQNPLHDGKNVNLYFLSLSFYLFYFFKSYSIFCNQKYEYATVQK